MLATIKLALYSRPIMTIDSPFLDMHLRLGFALAIMHAAFVACSLRSSGAASKCWLVLWTWNITHANFI